MNRKLITLAVVAVVAIAAAGVGGYVFFTSPGVDEAIVPPEPPPEPPVRNVSFLRVNATSPHVADGFDASVVTIRALDKNRDPVVGADIDVVFHSTLPGWRDSFDVFDAKEVGEGNYTMSFTSLYASRYAVIATDVATGVQSQNITEFRAGPPSELVTRIRGPNNIDTGDSFEVRVTALDVVGNTVLDAEIVGTTTLGELSQGVGDAEDGSTVFTHHYDDYGTAAVVFGTTEGSRPTSRVELLYAPGKLAVAVPVGFEPDFGGPTGVAADSPFNVSLSLTVSPKKGELGLYSAMVAFDSSALQLDGVTDGDPLDGFPAPFVRFVHGGVLLESFNSHNESEVNVDAALLLFTPLSINISVTYYNITVPALNLTTTTGTVISAPATTPGVTVVAKPTKEVPVKFWSVEGGDRSVTEISNDVIKTNEVFRKNAAKCTCSAILKIKIVGVNSISQADWEDIDDDDDGRLDGDEIDDLPTEEGVTTNVYYVPGIQSRSGSNLLGVSYGATNQVAVDNGLDHDNLTLGHELAHSWGDSVRDPTPGNLEAIPQGAFVWGNLMNYDRTGDDLTKIQCDLIVKGLKC